jgi:hypothetical protein
VTPSLAMGTPAPSAAPAPAATATRPAIDRNPFGTFGTAGASLTGSTTQTIVQDALAALRLTLQDEFDTQQRDMQFQHDREIALLNLRHTGGVRDRERERERSRRRERGGERVRESSSG